MSTSRIPITPRVTDDHAGKPVRPGARDRRQLEAAPNITLPAVHIDIAIATNAQILTAIIAGRGSAR